MEKQEKIDYLIELIRCTEPLYYWCYDDMAELLHSNCSGERALDIVFRSVGSLEYVYEQKTWMPLLLSHESGLIWIAVKEREGETLCRVHVLGPFYLGEVNTSYLEKLALTVSRNAASTQWRKRLIRQLQQLPALTTTLFFQYAVMLHYTVTGEKISASDIVYESDTVDTVRFTHIKKRTYLKDRQQIYRVERALLNTVREGDTAALKEGNRVGNVAHVRPYVDDPLQSARIACTIFTSLCVRAAIEGGLSPTLGYALGDAYIKSYYLAKSISEVGKIKNQMYGDFVNRVRQCRTNPKYSKAIQSCCEYIEMHLGEELTLQEMAERLGYTKYYLSRRFKEETGVTIHNYAKFARIERAKMLLSTSDRKIEEISAMLQFGSRSFFDKAFKKSVGMTPAQYRAEHLTV